MNKMFCQTSWRSLLPWLLRKSNFLLSETTHQTPGFYPELYSHCFLIKVINLQVFPITTTFQVLVCGFKSSPILPCISVVVRFTTDDRKPPVFLMHSMWIKHKPLHRLQVCFCFKNVKRISLLLEVLEVHDSLHFCSRSLKTSSP